jgi:hypothetical protein
MTVPLEIVTVAVAVLLVPPAPLQAKEYDVVDVSAAVICVPLVALAPPQPPLAAHEVALVELHVNVDVPEEATTVGLATKVAVGMTFTTMVDRPLVPPVPLHVKEYELGVVIPPVLCVPLAARAPFQLPDAVQDVALVELHVSVEALPLTTDVGLAVSVIVGAATTVTVAVAALLVPPAPAHVRE